VARGTQHRKRRTTAHARVTGPEPKGKAPKTKQPKHASWEEQLFFSRLRVHAKWVFLFLAVVFAVSFVIFGVGSGSTGIGDVLGNWFSGSSSSGQSVSSAQKKTIERPKDPKAWRELATVLEQKDRTDEAVAALERYTELKPKDERALQELGSLYLAQADAAAQRYVDAQTKTQTLTPGNTFRPSESSPFGKAFDDPLSTAVTESSSKIVADAYSDYIVAEGQAVDVYKRLVALNPKDATNQFRLAQVAQTAGDSQTAIAAYQKFLALAPNDSLAPSARRALKELTAPATPAATTG
jgi:tetratricopeptide (TPR) repeat protein